MSRIHDDKFLRSVGIAAEHIEAPEPSADTIFTAAMRAALQEMQPSCELLAITADGEIQEFVPLADWHALNHQLDEETRRRRDAQDGQARAEVLRGYAIWFSLTSWLAFALLVCVWWFA